MTMFFHQGIITRIVGFGSRYVIALSVDTFFLSNWCVIERDKFRKTANSLDTSLTLIDIRGVED